jgi:hypothetical protein
MSRILKMRASRSLVSMRCTSVANPGGISGQTSASGGTGSLRIDIMIWAICLPGKGGRPATISNSKAPNDQMSLRSSRSSPRSASGLM